MNICIHLNEADDNNIEEPCRAICTGALIFSSQFNIADINSTRDGPGDANNLKTLMFHLNNE